MLQAASLALAALVRRDAASAAGCLPGLLGALCTFLEAALSDSAVACVGTLARAVVVQV